MSDNQFKTKINSIIKTCLNSGEDIRNNFARYQQGLKELDIKKENFDKILSIIQEVDVDQIGMIEQLFNYKLNQKDEEKQEEANAILEFHNMELDPNSQSTKY